MICKTHINKDSWADGPWKQEPDHASFQHRGMHCELRRDADDGVWTGWVEVPPSSGAWDHPVDVHVHGEMYWVKSARKNFKDATFDCRHIDDLRPGKPLDEFDNPRQYRTFEYCVDQCRQLADQLARATVLRVACKDILQTLRWAMRRWRGAR